MPSLTRDQIQEILPHRDPFLFLDRIVECEWGVRAVGEIDDVAQYEEHVLRGHFPGFPVLPGAILIEALAEVGAIAALGMPENKGKIAMLTGVDGWKFRLPARPGMRIRLTAEVLRYRRGFGKGKGTAIDADTGGLLAEGEISFAIVEKPAEFTQK